MDFSVPEMSRLNELDFKELLVQGYTYFQVADAKKSGHFSKYPGIIIPPGFKVQEPKDGVLPTTFLLANGTRLDYAIINGFLIDLRKPLTFEGNSLIKK